MEVVIQEQLLMEKGMEKEKWFLKMEEAMMDNGKQIKWTDMEDYTMKVENWHIKETGRTINFMVKDAFIIKIPTNFRLHLL